MKTVANYCRLYDFGVQNRFFESLLDYILCGAGNNEEGRAILQEFEKELQYLVFLKKIQSQSNDILQMQLAMRFGSLVVVKYLFEHGSNISYYAIIDAAQNGHLECLRYAHACGYGPWGTLISDFCTNAAEGGHLECLKFLHQCGSTWDHRTCQAAVSSGSVECLRYLVENGCEWNDKSIELCDFYKGEGKENHSGKLQCLKYLHEEKNCSLTAELCAVAAGSGNLLCLQYLMEKGCGVDASTTKAAATSRNITCLQYLHKHNCPWDETACAAAAMGGKLANLHYLHENGCPWDVKTTEYAALWSDADRFACLAYAILQGCPASATVLTVYNTRLVGAENVPHNTKDCCCCWLWSAFRQL